MSAISPREKNMVLIAVVAILYAVAALSFKKQMTNWKVSKRIYVTAQNKVHEEQALISAKDEWAAKYEQMRELMPVFPYDKDVDTHWLNMMDSAATRNGLTIARRQTNKEIEVGDVYELPIDCKDWEGTLESLVKFLYDLHQEGAMLDVRQLFVRPANRPGYLKGTFTLYCAYMRGEEAKAAVPRKSSDGQNQSLRPESREEEPSASAADGAVEIKPPVTEPSPAPIPAAEAK